jgi:cold-inducible RNA-binding protein
MKNIYVGNLPYKITEDGLRSAFANYGKVGSVKIIRDQGGMPRGFAFVEMENETEAANAISGLNGSKLEGRVLTVNEAQQKSDRRKRMGGG